MLRLFSYRLFCLLATILFWPTAVLATVDISLQVSSSPTIVVLDRSAFLFAEVSNLGTETATDVVMTVSLPAGSNLVQASTSLGVCSGNPVVTCLLGDLPAGSLAVQATISIEVILSQVGSFNHEFEVTTALVDNDLINNNRTVTVDVVSFNESSDISVSFGMTSLLAMQNVRFSMPVDIVNHGPQGVSNVDVQLRIPALLLADLESAIPSQGHCISALTNCIGLGCITAQQTMLNVQCELGPLSTSEQANVTFNFFAASDIGEMFLLTANAFAPVRGDPDLNNNSASLIMEVIPVPDLDVPDSVATGCFIATAAYGSDMHDDVMLLRKFRDDHLLQSHWGRYFVDLYYRYSPMIADAIRSEPIYRRWVRGLIKPIVWSIRYPSIIIIVLMVVITWLMYAFILRLKRS